jgi:hypothetical protein
MELSAIVNQVFAADGLRKRSSMFTRLQAGREWRNNPSGFVVFLDSPTHNSNPFSRKNFSSLARNASRLIRMASVKISNVAFALETVS